MVYVVEIPLVKPYQQIADTPGWKEKVPDLEQRAAIADILMDGRKDGKTAELTTQEIPDILIIKKPSKKFPNVFTSNNGMIVVSSEVKDIIESLDRDIHQFLPVAVELRPRETTSISYFIINVSCRQSSIVDRLSNVEPHFTRKVERDVMYIRGPKEIHVDAAKAGKYHIWREERFPRSLLMSDALYKLLEEKGLQFFRAHKACNI